MELDVRVDTRVSVRRRGTADVFRIGLPVALAVILLWLSDVITDLPPALAAWATLIGILWLTALGFTRSRAAGENPWLSPSFIHMLYVVALQYGLGILFLLYGEFLADYMNWDTRGIFELQESIPRASWLIMIGALGTYAGMYVPVGAIARRLPALAWPENQRTFPLRALLIAPLTIAAYLYSFTGGALGEIQQTAYIIGTFGLVLMMCGFMRLLRGGAHLAAWRLVTGAVIVMFVGTLLFGGSRGVLMYVVMYYVWALIAVKGKASRGLIVVALLGIMVFSVVVFPLLSVYKFHRKGGLVPIGEAVQRTIEDYDSAAGEPRFAGSIEMLRATTYPATYVASYERIMPDVYPYLFGESPRVVLSGLVPRLVNPDKANVLDYVRGLAYRAGLFTEQTYFEAEQLGAIMIDYISEFYINFGPWGVLLFSLVQGIYLRIRYEWLIIRSRLDLGFPVYAVSFLTASAFWQMFVLDIKNWAIWIALLWLCSRRN